MRCVWEIFHDRRTARAAAATVHPGTLEDSRFGKAVIFGWIGHWRRRGRIAGVIADPVLEEVKRNIQNAVLVFFAIR